MIGSALFVCLLVTFTASAQPTEAPAPTATADAPTAVVVVPTPSPISSPTPVECMHCVGDHEQCLQDPGVTPTCGCMPRYRRDKNQACVESEDHIDMSLVPKDVQGKVESLEFKFFLTTMDARDFHCEIISGPNTGHFKYGTVTVAVASVVTRVETSITIPIENHITESTVMLSCYLTPTGGNYDSRVDLEIVTLAVLGASGMYDYVDTSSLPKYIAPVAKDTVIMATVEASALGPRDLHVDLIMKIDGGEQKLAEGKYHISGAAHLQNYTLYFTTSAALVLDGTGFWSAYLTPANQVYPDVVSYGQKVLITVGTAPPPTIPPTVVQAPTMVAAPTAAAKTAPPTKAPPPPTPFDPAAANGTKVVEPAAHDNWWWWIVLLVVVMLLVGAFLLWRTLQLQKKKAEDYVNLSTSLNANADFSGTPMTADV